MLIISRVVIINNPVIINIKLLAAGAYIFPGGHIYFSSGHHIAISCMFIFMTTPTLLFLFMNICPCSIFKSFLPTLNCYLPPFLFKNTPPATFL